jgi:hypothetical protein
MPETACAFFFRDSCSFCVDSWFQSYTVNIFDLLINFVRQNLGDSNVRAFTIVAPAILAAVRGATRSPMSAKREQLLAKRQTRSTISNPKSEIPHPKLA